MSLDTVIISEPTRRCQVLSKLTKHRRLNMDFAKRVWEQHPGDKSAAAIWSCGTQVGVTLTEPAEVVESNFCRDRWCPTCQWRRSRLLYHQNVAVYNRLAEQGDYRFVFLTLTVPNVQLAGLKTMLRDMSAGWNRLKSNRSFKALNILGSLRTVEVTYNAKENTWHPHYHCVFVLDRKNWLHPDQGWWLDLWRTSMRMPDITQVDIRTVKGQRTQYGVDYSKAIKEVSKYVVKSSSLFGFDFGDWPYMRAAFNGCRFFACSGIWKDIRAELALVDPDHADLCDPVNDGRFVYHYRWDDVAMMYTPMGITVQGSFPEY